MVDSGKKITLLSRFHLWTCIQNQIQVISVNEPALLDQSLLVVQLGEFLPDRVDQLDLSPRETHQHRDDALSPGGSVGGSDDGTKVVARGTRTLFHGEVKQD